jgi:hypothetical protein
VKGSVVRPGCCAAVGGREQLYERPRLALFAREAETTAHPSARAPATEELAHTGPVLGVEVGCCRSAVVAEAHSFLTSQLRLGRGQRRGGGGEGANGGRGQIRAAVGAAEPMQIPTTRMGLADAQLHSNPLNARAPIWLLAAGLCVGPRSASATHSGFKRAVKQNSGF